MKKIMALFLCLLLLFTTAYASSTSYRAVPTDIRVFLHGKEIPSCAVNNSMYISADDFAEYGYTVTYVDEVRTLFVNKTGKPSDIMPEPCRVYKTYETDIMVMLNGEFIEKNDLFAANGKMYICANAITYYVSGQNVFDTGIPRYKYNLMPVWDDENRIYYIDDAQMPTKEEQVADFLSYDGNRENYSSFLSFTENYYTGDGFEIVSLRIGGLPHGATTRWYYFSDDGKSFSINTVCSPFRMHSAWGISSITNPRVEGRKFYFDGMRTMNLAVPSEGIYEGKYYLDLDTTVVHTIEETPVQ
ncbi:MAG: hypothetical protein IKB50_00300 [Clostridia bacterium]|nr:hypothetical protein [Clostridia bacterium]